MHLVRLGSLGTSVAIAGQGHTEHHLSRLIIIIIMIIMIIVLMIIIMVIMMMIKRHSPIGRTICPPQSVDLPHCEFSELVIDTSIKISSF